MVESVYKLFRCVGVVITGVKTATQFTVLPVVNVTGVVNLALLPFDVDLLASPSHGAWANVQVDDRGVDAGGNPLGPNLNATEVPLGITTIGSGIAKSLLVSAYIGAVYVENSYYESRKIEAWPPAQYALYQLTSIAYKTGTDSPYAGRRYHGFIGKITAVSGNLLQVSFTNPDNVVVGTWWINSADPNEALATPPIEACESMPKGQVLLTDKPAVGQQGPIFLTLTNAVSLGLDGPKVPIGGGF